MTYKVLSVWAVRVWQFSKKWHTIILIYPEQVESRIEHFLNDLLQKLFKDTILIDTGLVHSQVVNKLDTDDTFYRIHW